jgi:saccharopine dehydrogenase-like NADP-dependent oxidoreductase
MKQYDMVVNTVGPFFRFGVPILKAAIEAQCKYVDICDDPEPTLEMLKLNEQAKAAGVTALIGTGASPGIANMLAVRAARELDTVDSIITGWNIDASHPEERHGSGVSAAVVHMMEQISGLIPVTRGGKLEYRRALEKIEIDYPGLHKFTSSSIGHPEAVTLHHAFPTLRDNTNVCVCDKFTTGLLNLVRRLINARVLKVETAASILDRAFSMVPSRPTDFLKPGSPPPLFAIASGTRNGQRGTAATALANGPGFTMAATTGVPLAVCTLLLANQDKPGVHVPETLIDPDDFFNVLAPHCIGNPRPETMTATTTSWMSPNENRKAFGVSFVTSLLTLGSR